MLGAIGFAASALAGPASDKWIGWPSEVRRVPGLSRFRIHPWVRVPCLASKALGLSLRCLAEDWERRHGV